MPSTERHHHIPHPTAVLWNTSAACGQQGQHKISAVNRSKIYHETYREPSFITLEMSRKIPLLRFPAGIFCQALSSAKIELCYVALLVPCINGDHHCWQETWLCSILVSSNSTQDAHWVHALWDFSVSFKTVLISGLTPKSTWKFIAVFLCISDFTKYVKDIDKI